MKFTIKVRIDILIDEATRYSFKTTKIVLKLLISNCTHADHIFKNTLKLRCALLIPKKYR